MPINHNPEKRSEEHVEKKNRISFSLTAPKYSFSDIILPQKTLEEIDLLLSLIKNDSLIFDSWGLGRVIKPLRRIRNRKDYGGSCNCVCFE